MDHSLGQNKPVVYAILFTFIVIEMIWSWRRQKHVYDVKDTAANITIFIGYILSKLVSAGYQLAFLGIFYQYRVHTFHRSLPLFLITIVAVDFCYYWFHRISHVVKFFWAFHFIHHSSQHMNFSVAYRLNWFSFLISPIFYIPLVLIGIPTFYVIGAYALNLFYQFFLHTEAIRRLGPIEYVFNTPSNHRVHHGSNDVYIDKNFGGILIIWDRIFGTYQAEEEKVVYGVTTGFAGHNPIALIFKGFYDYATGKMNYKG